MSKAKGQDSEGKDSGVRIQDRSGGPARWTCGASKAGFRRAGFRGQDSGFRKGWLQLWLFFPRILTPESCILPCGFHAPKISDSATLKPGNSSYLRPSLPGSASNCSSVITLLVAMRDYRGRTSTGQTPARATPRTDVLREAYFCESYLSATATYGPRSSLSILKLSTSQRPDGSISKCSEPLPFSLKSLYQS